MRIEYPSALDLKAVTAPHSMGICSSCLGFGRRSSDAEVCELRSHPFRSPIPPLTSPLHSESRDVSLTVRRSLPLSIRYHCPAAAAHGVSARSGSTPAGKRSHGQDLSCDDRVSFVWEWGFGGSEADCVAVRSDVVDIFTVLPPSTEQARPQSKDAPPKKREIKNQGEIAYRSIRRSRAGPISSASNKDEPGWKAAQKIMG